MNTLPYILQTQACIALFWIVYRLCMRGSGAFLHNRIYLLASIPLAFIIPAVSIPVWPAPEAQPLTGIFDIGALEAFIVPAEEIKRFAWQDIAVWIYLTGALVMLWGVIRQLMKMRSSLRRSRVVRMDNVKIVSHEAVKSPYSFFRYIFVSPEPDESKELLQIVAHEMAHVRMGHSYDSVFAQLTLIFFWWNPFVWLWNRSLKEVHEFQADAAVLKLGFDSKQYVTLLIGTLAGIHPGLVSNFSYSLLKNRLLMMTKKQNGRLAGFRILAVAPLVAVLLMLFSFTEKSGAANEILPESVASSETQPPPAGEGEPLVLLDGKEITGAEMSRLDPSAVESISVLKGESARQTHGEAAANGAILVTTKAGSTALLSTPNPGNTLDDVVVTGYGVQRKESAPLSTPNPGNTLDGVVVTGYGVQRKSNVTGDGEAASNASPSIWQRGGQPTGDPLVIVDGQKAKMSDVDIHTVKNISVLKDESATRAYGEEGKNGVILITTKSDSTARMTAPAQRNNSSNNTVAASTNIVLTSAVRVNSTADLFTIHSPSGIVLGDNGQAPLVFVNGEKKDISTVNAMDPKTIESIEVLKDESATRAYGEEGKNGAILVTTKAE